jgi:hypothetical protein
MAKLAGLPPASDASSLELTITPGPGSERWARQFGSATLLTVQSERVGLLAERARALEFLFRLEEDNGKLRFNQRGVSLQWARLRIPLPKWLSPRVEAVESASGTNRTHISVVVSAPFLGLLVAYDGHVDWERP